MTDCTGTHNWNLIDEEDRRFECIECHEQVTMPGLTAYHDIDNPFIPCKWCGVRTQMRATKCCQDCWELETRIPSKMSVIYRMLSLFDN